jgi:hypothetical protein
MASHWPPEKLPLRKKRSWQMGCTIERVQLLFVPDIPTTNFLAPPAL